MDNDCSGVADDSEFCGGPTVTPATPWTTPGPTPSPWTTVTPITPTGPPATPVVTATPGTSPTTEPTLTPEPYDNDRFGEDAVNLPGCVCNHSAPAGPGIWDIAGVLAGLWFIRKRRR